MGRKEEKEKRDKAERKKTALDFLRAKYDNEANSSQVCTHEREHLWFLDTNQADVHASEPISFASTANGR